MGPAPGPDIPTKISPAPWPRSSWEPPLQKLYISPTAIIDELHVPLPGASGPETPIEPAVVVGGSENAIAVLGLLAGSTVEAIELLYQILKMASVMFVMIR